ncbi:hypothetical protein I4U23_011711 [Adineta vaga]|nr:hypothetical protein I4U23_011711 [Adineta vaga]
MVDDTSNCRECMRKPMHIRNHTRSGLSMSQQGTDSIKLDELKDIRADKNDDNLYWYHATNWDNAECIIKCGPAPSNKPGDLSTSRTAFYLNPDYDDCYNWLLTKNSEFKGYHAVLIFKFAPEEISENGRRLTKQEWKQIASNSSTKVCRSNDWLLAYQSANPESMGKKGQTPEIRRTSAGENAKQLIIYCAKMCRNLRSCLIGCVFYQKVISINRFHKNDYDRENFLIKTNPNKRSKKKSTVKQEEKHHRKHTYGNAD